MQSRAHQRLQTGWHDHLHSKCINCGKQLHIHTTECENHRSSDNSKRFLYTLGPNTNLKLNVWCVWNVSGSVPSHCTSQSHCSFGSYHALCTFAPRVPGHCSMLTVMSETPQFRCQASHVMSQCWTACTNVSPLREYNCLIMKNKGRIFQLLFISI